jgi:hypothetical protein
MTEHEPHHNHAFEMVDGAYTCTGSQFEGCGAYIWKGVLMAVRTPTLCRLDHWTPQGWQTIAPAVALLFPERYPERLEEKGKFGRAVELGEDLQPTGVEHRPSRLPKRTELVPTDSAAWGLPDPNRRGMCRHCDGYHGDPFDGSCLI